MGGQLAEIFFAVAERLSQPLVAALEQPVVESDVIAAAKAEQQRGGMRKLRAFYLVKGGAPENAPCLKRASPLAVSETLVALGERRLVPGRSAVGGFGAAFQQSRELGRDQRRRKRERDCRQNRRRKTGRVTDG